VQGLGGRGFAGPKVKAIVAGYFDSAWKISKASTWHMDKVLKPEE
jgi:hypothetical protein